MKLKQLIKSLDNFEIQPGLEDFEAKGISCNSRDIRDDFIFVAIKGVNADGHRFIEEAVRNGARAVVVQCGFGIQTRIGSISVIKVDDTRKAAAKLAAEFYGNPSKKIKVAGITGTNGKTTVSYLIEALLKEAGFNPAVIGTVNHRFGANVFASQNTTPGPVQLQSLFSRMLEAAVDYAVMEVSSHALEQGRTEGINFRIAIFTNLTQDHLDYHRTLENYFHAKAKLFKSLRHLSFAVINQDDRYGRRLKELTKAKIITYGIENQADVMAQNLKFDTAHTQFTLLLSGSQMRLCTNLIGSHNVYNILAAVSWAQAEGLELSIIKSAIEKFAVVPGRLEKIDFKGDFQVFVDYAHTEDALANVIKALRQVSSKRIIVLFGCGGQRDKTKRPKMGRIVTELADFAIVTSDNPRSEDPQAIIEDIKKGIRKDNYCVIADRMEAIKKSLSLAKSQDIVLLAGKGHEDYQVLGDKQIHFDDREAARECLKSMNY